MSKNKKKYLKYDNKVMMIDGENISISDKLDAGVYTMKFNKFQGIYLEELGTFQVPEKLYGNITDRFERIATSYEVTDKSLGVILSGVKGSGKTLLAKVMGNYYSSSMPVILVNEQFEPNMFIDFVSQIGEAMFIFDEFDKTFYDTSEDCDGDEPQHALLTLLDGLYSSKKLFVFTCNDKNKINKYLIHRPSRIRYVFEYDVLDRDTVSEVCDDRLELKEYKKSVLALSTLYASFTFDTLNALIDEVNVFKQSPVDLIDGMNIKDARYSLIGGHKEFKVTVSHKGQEVSSREHNDFNPMSYSGSCLAIDLEDGSRQYIYPNRYNLVQFDDVTGTYTYEVDGFTVTAKEVVKEQVDLSKVL